LISELFGKGHLWQPNLSEDSENVAGLREFASPKQQQRNRHRWVKG
jgi:hypothetical protein